MDLKKILIAAAIAVALLVTISIFLWCRLWISHRKKNKSQKQTNQDDDGSEDAEFWKAFPLSDFLPRSNSWRTLSRNEFASFIDYKIIEKWTENFSQANLLTMGKCGFKPVYKALLENGSEAVVKKLSCSTPVSQREFENEVDLLSRIHHSNVISLHGYSIDNDTGFVVQEFMPNGSLETQLHGPSRGSELTWHRRLKIALDIASGLEYLHVQCIPAIFHRAVRSSHILLDSNFNAKLSEFSIAVVEGKEKKNIPMLVGTVGFVAPEYMFHGTLTDASDVYAFGVVLMELLLGRRPFEMLHTSGPQALVIWARDLLTNGEVLRNIVDPVIRGTMNLNHLNQVAGIAYLCVQEEPAHRPLITDILQSLIPFVPMELEGTSKV